MVITVFGLGFVGLTTALGFADMGHTVYGVEVDDSRMLVITAGNLPFFEPGLDDALLRHLNKGFLPCEDLAKAIAESTCVFYAVDTPYGQNGQADLTFLFRAIEQTLSAIKDDTFRVLVAKSTIPPTTTVSKIIPFIEAKGFKVGKQIGIANNPEFLREGYCWEDFVHADRVVLGVEDERSCTILRELYASITAPIFCVNFNTGEYIKYLSNTLLATLISYSNEMSIIADTLGGIDIAEAFNILHTDKRWDGCLMASYAYPGCGYGGCCLPKDTNAMYSISKQAGFDPQILKNVIATNDRMPDFIVNRIQHTVGEDKNTCIGLLGLSFKPGSDDVRETPSARIIAKLNERGYKNILAYDPAAQRAFQKNYALDYQCVECYEQIIQDSEVLVIATAWPEFKNIRETTDKTVIDCRYML